MSNLFLWKNACLSMKIVHDLFCWLLFCPLVEEGALLFPNIWSMGPYCYDRMHGWYLLKLLDLIVAYLRGQNPKGRYNVWSLFAIGRDVTLMLFNQVLNVLSFPSPSVFLSCFCGLFPVIVPDGPWSNDVKGSIAHHWCQKVIFLPSLFQSAFMHDSVKRF